MRRDTISTTDHHLHPHMSTIPHTKIEINSFEKTIKEKKTIVSVGKEEQLFDSKIRLSHINSTSEKF